MADDVTTFDIVIPIIPIVLGAGMVGFWLLATAVLRRMAGMSSDPELRALARTATARSRWSSGRIGPLSFSRCLQVLRIEHGFLLRIMPVFGIGYLRIADADVQEIRTGMQFFMSQHATIITRADIITLQGSAAQFVLDHRSDGSATP